MKISFSSFSFFVCLLAIPLLIIGIPASKEMPSNGISLTVLVSDGKQSSFLFLKERDDLVLLPGDKQKGII